jgi:hypothetical protein
MKIRRDVPSQFFWCLSAIVVVAMIRDKVKSMPKAIRILVAIADEENQ